MDSLVTSLLDGKNVVFVTGSGLSVASGIPPFRGKSNEGWEKFQTEFATRRRFKKDPLRWWNDFWLKAHEKVLLFFFSHTLYLQYALTCQNLTANVHVGRFESWTSGGRARVQTLSSFSRDHDEYRRSSRKDHTMSW